MQFRKIDPIVHLAISFSPSSSSLFLVFFLVFSMDFPQNHFQQPYQPQQNQQSKDLRNFYSIEGHTSPSVAYYSQTNFQDQSQHPPYIPPPFHVVGVAPVPAHVADGSDGGADLRYNYELEPKRKKLKEQDFLENNSQISSIDFLQARSVSTGLGLSLDNTHISSSGDSSLISLIGDDIERELHQQDAEIDRFLKVQADQLRQTILEKIQATQLQTISLVQKQVVQKLREKEAELESINKRNAELEDQMEQLSVEAGAWQQRAQYTENVINALKYNLQQVYAQSRDSKEGCGDSEVDDTASCCNGGAIDFQLLPKEKNDPKELMICRVCRVKEVGMLLIPCKHLCLCKDCSSKVSFCPICRSKFVAMEVYV